VSDSTLGLSTALGNSPPPDTGAEEDLPEVPFSLSKAAGNVASTMVEGAKEIGNDVGNVVSSAASSVGKLASETAKGYGKLLSDYSSPQGPPKSTYEATQAALDTAIDDSWFGKTPSLNAPADALLAGVLPEDLPTRDAPPDHASGVINRFLKSKAVEAQASPTLSPEEANQKYPYMPTPYREPVSALVAQYRADEFLRQDKRQQALDGAPNYGPIGALSNMALDMGVGFTDPGTIAGMVAGGVAAGALMKTGTVAKAAAALGKYSPELAKLGESVLHGTVNDLAFNTTAEAGKQIVAKSEKVQPYTLADSGAAILQGMALSPVFAGLHYGASRMARIGEVPAKVPFVEKTPQEQTQIRMGRQLQETSPEAGPLIMRQAAQNVLNGVRPDVEPVFKSIAHETALTEVPGVHKYNYEPLGGTSPEGKKYYYVTEGGNEPGVKRLFTSDSMGTGTHLTDNPLVANPTGARELSHGTGSIVPVEMPHLKIFKLNEMLSPEMPEHGVFADALEKTGMPRDVAEQVLSERTPKDIVDWLQDHNAANPPKPYEYVPHEGSVVGKEFYHGTKSALKSLKDSSATDFSQPGNLYGNGVYLTDNPEVARSYADNKGPGESGKVLSSRLKDLNLINLEKELPEGAAAVFQKFIDQENKHNDRFVIKPGTLGKDVFNELKEILYAKDTPSSEYHDIYQGLSLDLREAGYDGLLHEGQGVAGGTKLGKHNVAIVFDNENLKVDHALTDVHTGTDPVDVYQNGLKELGYDASHQDGTTRMGFEHPEHNAIMMLDESKIPEGLPHYDANRDIQNRNNADEIQAARDNQGNLANRWDLDAAGAKVLEDKIHGVEFTPNHVEKIAGENFKNSLEGLQTMKEQDNLPKEFHKALEELSNAEGDHEIQEKAVKALQWCLKGA
jgi:hypothetical protein